MTPRRRAALELAAVGASMAVRLAARGTALEFPVVLALAVGWGGYLAARLAFVPGTWRQWGLGADGLAAGLRWHGAATAVTLAAIAGLAYALRLGHAWHPTAANLALYLVWAFVQEAVLQGVLAAGFLGIGVPVRWMPPVASVVFAAAHLPDLQLAGLALAGGLLWTMLFLRVRCLWTLAASHALLGAAALGLLFGRDPADAFAPWLWRFLQGG